MIEMAKFKKTHDSDLCILPMAEREKEIADASARTMVLSEQIASAPPGVDVSELRHQLAMLSGKMGRHARASDNWGTPEELAEQEKRRKLRAYYRKRNERNKERKRQKVAEEAAKTDTDIKTA